MPEYTTPTQYKLDTEKINSLEDVIEVLDALDLQMTDRHPNFDKFEPYLTEVNE